MTEASQDDTPAKPETGTATLEVALVLRAPEWKVSGIPAEVLRRTAAAAFAAGLEASKPGFGLAGAYEVTLVLSDDAEIRGLNRQWRGKDAPTNVLSFPSGEPLSNEAISELMASEAISLGDIVLSLGTLKREAEEQGVTLSDHARHLVVHGVLHLLGFDHTDDEEAAIMERLETEILRDMGIADPYRDAPGGTE